MPTSNVWKSKLQYVSDNRFRLASTGTCNINGRNISFSVLV